MDKEKDFDSEESTAPDGKCGGECNQTIKNIYETTINFVHKVKAIDYYHDLFSTSLYKNYEWII